MFNNLNLDRISRIVLLASVSSLATPALAQSENDARSTIEEIVVTAQKQEENLQTVPIAISAFTSESIRELRIQNARDLNGLVPGLTIGANPGGSQSGSYVLRGALSQPSYAGQNGALTFYVDGVPIGSNVGQFFELADIERIEVLRGPQGTLFGRNATAGAVSITTRNPSGEFSVRSENTYGNYNQFRSKTRVDLPAFGPLSISATYMHSEREGDIRNIGAGTRWDYGPATDGNYGIRTASKRLGDHNIDAVTVSALYEPSSELSLIYKFDYLNEVYTDNGQLPVSFGFGGVGSSGFTIAVARALYAAQPAALRSPITRVRPKAANNSFTTGGDLDVYGHSLTLNWDATDNLSIKNILAYRKVHLVFTAGVDGFGFAGLPTPPASTVGIPVPGLTIGQVLGGTSTLATLIGVSGVSKQDQFSNELQAIFTQDAFEFTVGGLYYSETSASIPFENKAAFPTGTLTSLFFAAAPPAPGQPVVLVNQGYQKSFVKTKSFAIYGQPKFHLTDQLDLVLGGRMTWDRKDGVDAFSSPRVPILNNNVRYRDEQRPTWLAGLNFQANRDTLIYAKASTGFISGGVLGSIAFRPEKARSIEVGVKSDLFDRHVRLNFAAHTTNYSDLQVGTVFNPPGGGSLNVIANFGDARVQGLELEATVIPVSGLTLSGNVGYSEFKLKRIDPIFSTGLNTQPYAVVPQLRPKWTAQLNAQYETPEMSWGGHIVVRGDANWRSAMFLSPRGYDDNGDGSFNSSDQTWDIIRAEPRWILNGRIAATDIHLGSVDAELAIFGRNLTNNKDLQFITWIGFGYEGSFERARTYGVDLTVNF